MKKQSCKTLKRCILWQADEAVSLMDLFGFLLSQQGWHLLPWDLLSEEWTKIGLQIDVIQPMAIRGVSYHKLEPIAAERKSTDLREALQHRGRKVNHHWLWLTPGFLFSCSMVCAFFSQIFCCRAELGRERSRQSCSGGGKVIVAWFILHSSRKLSPLEFSLL